MCAKEEEDKFSLYGLYACLCMFHQEAPLQAAQKVQEQFRAIITKTSELAKQGHTGAKMVLDSLQIAGGPGRPGQ
jgi:hypothetical protein